MFKSIRWTLQLWHAAILLLAIGSLGAAMYFGVERARYQAVDAELEGAARAIVDRLRAPPPPRQPPPPRFDDRPFRPGNDRRPPPPPRPDDAGPPGGDAGAPLPPPDPEDGDDPQRPRGGGEPPPPLMRERRPQQDPANIPADFLHRVGEREEDQPYFIIWRPDGSILRAASADLKVPPPGPAEAPPPARGNDDGPDADRAEPRPAPLDPPPIRMRDGNRELVVPGPRGLRVLVGRSIGRERHDLHQLLLVLIAGGAGVMGIGLIGGWRLAGRAIRPIDTITRTARSISSTDLSRRIPVSGTQSELGELAQTLNETFARLDAAFQRQSRFTADASHELRTPLSVMHTNLELALTKDRSGEEYRQTLGACLRAARRMGALVESLLVLARADAGRLELRHEPVDLGEIAGECAAMFAPLAAERQVRLETSTGPATGPATVRGDRTRLTQVITNLIANAIHYNRPGGSVTVSVRDESGRAICRVADTGIGIAEADQPRVFERFFRADKSRSRDAGGSGLGLAICKSIIEAHGGSIGLESVPGQGTIVTLSIPVSGGIVQ